MAVTRDVDSSVLQRKRKRRQCSPEDSSSENDTRNGTDTTGNSADSLLAGQSSNFRNVSACSRCRSRKNRCDQRLPSCSSCAKVGASCVGYDVITKREIPRSYVFYLENRLEELEKILVSHGIAFPSADNLELSSRKESKTPKLLARLGTPENADTASAAAGDDSHRDETPDSQTAASFMSMAFQTIQTHKQHAPKADSKAAAAAMSLPDRSTGLQLVRAYFNRANPQLPIVQSGCFMVMFKKAYSNQGCGLMPREQYMLNMVFAIGCSHGFIEEQAKDMATDASSLVPKKSKNSPPSPEEYYRRALVHFDSCIKPENGSLHVLQAILLLASFSLLRPVPPGVWYITGMAMRIAVDLGLQCEGNNTRHVSATDRFQSDAVDEENSESMQTMDKATRELRRRLWWCTYSLDRLVSISVGRPFSISDHDISTPLPSLQEYDAETEAISASPSDSQDQQQSYRYITHHFIKLRLLQSEIYATTRNYRPRSNPTSPQSPTEESNCSSPPGLEPEHVWLEGMEKRLHEWKTSAPTTDLTGVSFPKAIFEFYYWQTIMLLYQRNTKVPTLIQDVHSTLRDLQTLTTPTAKDSCPQWRYLKTAEAGQKVLRMYRQRHLVGCIKYTYSSALYLFSVAISYLHAVSQSSAVRNRLSLDDLDFTILAAKSIFSDMLDTCPDANMWMEAFELTSKAATKITRLYGDFGKQSQQTDWEEDESNSIMQDLPLNTLDPHMSPRPGTLSYPSPDNLESWDFTNDGKPLRFGDGNISALDMPLPPLSPLGSSSSHVHSETRNSEQAACKELFDLETIWQLSNLATEAPYIYGAINQE